MKCITVAAALLILSGSAARADNFLVLPFFNQTSDKNLNWIGDSLAEAAREALASEGLVALDRQDRTEAYQRLSIRPYTLLTKASVMKIGQQLDAEQVIYGEFSVKPGSGQEKSRGSLQVVAHVLDLKHSRQGPEFTEIGALEDLAGLQRHLAWQALKFADPRGAPSEAEFIRRHPAVRLDAIENYVRGLLVENADAKHRLFTQAVRLEPQFTQPCYQLGRLYLQKNEYKLAADWFQKVSGDDVHYREASFLLGLCRFHTGDYTAAEAAFQSVALIVPLNEVYNNLGAAQSRRNRPAALENFKKAVEGDSGDPIYHFNIGYVLWKQSRFDEAAVSFRAVLERNPDDDQTKVLLARCQSRSGPRPGDTKTDALERLKANYEESAWWQLKAALQPAKD